MAVATRSAGEALVAAQASAAIVAAQPMLSGSALVGGIPVASSVPAPEIDRERHPSGIVPTIQNVVATVNLGCPLELKKIAMHARNAEYNPKRFTAVIMRLLDPKTTALIFASGKVVVTGAKSEEAARLAARKYARIIQKLDFPARFTEFKIQNIVASCDVKFAIRLEGLAANHGHFSSVRTCCAHAPLRGRICASRATQLNHPHIPRCGFPLGAAPRSTSPSSFPASSTGTKTQRWSS
jgi:hypothetical protein